MAVRGDPQRLAFQAQQATIQQGARTGVAQLGQTLIEHVVQGFRLGQRAAPSGNRWLNGMAAPWKARQSMNADFAPIVDENHWMAVKTPWP